MFTYSLIPNIYIYIFFWVVQYLQSTFLRVFLSEVFNIATFIQAKFKNQMLRYALLEVHFQYIDSQILKNKEI